MKSRLLSGARQSLFSLYVQQRQQRGIKVGKQLHTHTQSAINQSCWTSTHAGMFNSDVHRFSFQIFVALCEHQERPREKMQA